MSSSTPVSTSLQDISSVAVKSHEPDVATAENREGVSTWRWLAIAVFVLFSALNFLDRQLLAAVAPSLMSEFNLSSTGYGTLLSAFSFSYMLMAPAAGLLVDRIGLRAGAMLAAGLWSIVGAGTGFVSGFAGLLGCRMGLGLAEAAGIPCSSKASATYLRPGEQGVGIAVQTIGFTLGSMAAPLAVVLISPRYGWRGTFLICGLLGLLWLPVFFLISRRIPARHARGSAPFASGMLEVVTDARFLVILVANVLIMAMHSMWMNWTTVFFVRVYGMTQSDANWYFAWIPPIFATLGGLFGAWLTIRATARGLSPVGARLRLCRALAPTLLITALVPWIPSPALAAVGISASFFLCMAVLNNLHVLPIDLFGAHRAAFTSALIVSSYAAMQVVLSPAMGFVVDRFGFHWLCAVVAVLPGAGAFLLKGVEQSPTRSELVGA